MACVLQNLEDKTVIISSPLKIFWFYATILIGGNQLKVINYFDKLLYFHHHQKPFDPRHNFNGLKSTERDQLIWQILHFTTDLKLKSLTKCAAKMVGQVY